MLIFHFSFFSFSTRLYLNCYRVRSEHYLISPYHIHIDIQKIRLGFTFWSKLVVSRWMQSSPTKDYNNNTANTRIPQYAEFRTQLLRWQGVVFSFHLQMCVLHCWFCTILIMAIQTVISINNLFERVKTRKSAKCFDFHSIAKFT